MTVEVLPVSERPDRPACRKPRHTAACGRTGRTSAARRTRGLLHTAIEVLREPMILLLLAAGASTCSSATAKRPSSCSGPSG